MKSKLTAKLFVGVKAVVCGSALLLAVGSQTADAITLQVDYSYDDAKFFSTGNPAGAAAAAQAKAALEAAASYYSQTLTDTFSSIQTPPPLHSSQFGGVATWTWSMTFPKPSTGIEISVIDPTLGADIYRIYAGARPLSGTTIGIGGIGGRTVDQIITGGGQFTPAEGNQIDQTWTNFQNAVIKRGETSGFAGWGGAITFDTRATTQWHFNHTTAPTVGTNDFFSVALHELGHALGLGASTTWNMFTAGPNFSGPAATSVYGSNPPLNPGKSHWASGTMSTVFGTGTAQEAAMDPEITTGTRKRLTTLDAAALSDIGWTVAAPPAPNYLAADFNEDAFVNGADLAMWKAAFGMNNSGDANNDNRTDGNDFLIWQRQRGTSPPSIPAGIGAFAKVPEPHSYLLAIGGYAGLAVQRRRRAARPS